MIFVFISFAVPALLFSLWPLVLKLQLGKQPPRDFLLLGACTLFAISWYLPSPLINGMETQFTTHFVGGGLFCGFLWLYTKRALKWNGTWWLEALSLYATVSVLGVTNELFEFTITRLHLVRLSGADAWWDLVANTLGAAVFWVIYTIYDRTRMDRRASR